MIINKIMNIKNFRYTETLFKIPFCSILYTVHACQHCCTPRIA